MLLPTPRWMYLQWLHSNLCFQIGKIKISLLQLFDRTLLTINFATETPLHSGIGHMIDYRRTNVAIEAFYILVPLFVSLITMILMACHYGIGAAYMPSGFVATAVSLLFIKAAIWWFIMREHFFGIRRLKSLGQQLLIIIISRQQWFIIYFYKSILLNQVLLNYFFYNTGKN